MIFLLDFENSWHVVESFSHDTAPNAGRTLWPEHQTKVCWVHVIPQDQAHKVPPDMTDEPITPAQAKELLDVTGQNGDDAEIYVDCPCP